MTAIIFVVFWFSVEINHYKKKDNKFKKMVHLTKFQETYYQSIHPFFLNEIGQLICQFLTFYPKKKILKGHCMEITCCIISHDEHVLISSSKDGYVRFWNLEMGKCVKILKQLENVIGLQLSFDDQILVTRSTSLGVSLWNVEQGKKKSKRFHFT